MTVPTDSVGAADAATPADPVQPLWTDVRGSGPAVVLLHGQPGRSRDWAAVTPLLTATSTVVAVDRPGYGRSGGPAGDFAANARSVVATLDHLGIDRAVAVGHSWGGGVALALAVDHPDRVSGVVLVSSTGPGDVPGRLDLLLGAPLLGEVVVSSTFRVARAVLHRPSVLRGLHRVLPASGRATLEVVAGGHQPEPAPAATRADPWRSFLVEQRVFNDHSADGFAGLAARLGDVAVPVTALTGTADRIVDPSVASRLTEAIPGARLVRIPGAGHLLPFDHPGEIAEAVREVSVRAAPTGPPDPAPPPGSGRC